MAFPSLLLSTLPHLLDFTLYCMQAHTIGFNYSNNASSLKGLQDENLCVWSVLFVLDFPEAMETQLEIIGLSSP